LIDTTSNIEFVVRQPADAQRKRNGQHTGFERFYRMEANRYRPPKGSPSWRQNPN